MERAKSRFDIYTAVIDCIPDTSDNERANSLSGQMN